MQAHFELKWPKCKSTKEWFLQSSLEGSERDPAWKCNVRPVKRLKSLGTAWQQLENLCLDSIVSRTYQPHHSQTTGVKCGATDLILKGGSIR